MWRLMFAMSLMSKTPGQVATPAVPETELAPIVPGAWRAWAATYTAPEPAPAGFKVRLAKAAKSA